MTDSVPRLRQAATPLGVSGRQRSGQRGKNDEKRVILQHEK